MQLIGAGRDADVFDLGDGTVLRRNRDGRSSEREGALMAHLADLGYPLPRVHAAEGAEIVMDRVDGPTLGEALLSGATDPMDGADLLGALHRRLHRLAWPQARPGEALLHLDLHPFNVVLTPTGPVVIDWTNARTGPPGLDVAVTVLTVAQAGLADPSLGELVVGFAEEFAGRAGTPYAANLAEATEYRRRDLNQTPEETACFDDAVALVRIWAGHRTGVHAL